MANFLGLTDLWLLVDRHAQPEFTRSCNYDMHVNEFDDVFVVTGKITGYLILWGNNDEVFYKFNWRLLLLLGSYILKF